MNDLSMYILDIAQNSIKANAKNLTVSLNEDVINNKLVITFEDDGIGMDKETLENVTSPFFTTRTTRNVGLGLPFLKMITNMCDGDLVVESTKNVGTTVKTSFRYDHIDRPDFGDLVETVYTLCINPNKVNILYRHSYNNKLFEFDSLEVKKILEGVPFEQYEVMKFIKKYLEDNIKNLKEEN